ncbi:MAG: hypothetical protein IT386_14315 [Deltaproteobacteria bacterium]|nr:hypothetical protein [Deltaproteobacteria bacterium]
MLSGFNTNVRHRGLLLHVQTEDSGRAHPHVITHLYHGGTILASERSEYGDRLGSDALADEVRRLMEGQHRAMLRRLRRGELDDRLVERLGRDAIAAGSTAATASGETGPAAPVSSAGEPPATPAAVSARAPDDRRLDEVVAEYLEQRARRRRRP